MKISKQLENAYRETLYCTQGMVLRIGKKSRAMDIFLRTHEERCWGFITAYNPESRSYPLKTNILRNAQLKDMLLERGYTKIFEGEGKGLTGNWTPEASFLVLGISRLDAELVGKHFRQNAVVWGEIEQEAELVLLV